MRKILLHMQITADGFTTGPNGEVRWVYTHTNHEVDRFNAALYEQADMVLMGRMLYQEMAAFWPQAEHDPLVRDIDRRFARLMNTIPKLVFSRTLDSAEWQNTRVAQEIALEMEQLRARPGRDLILAGGATIAREFMRLGLVDEYHILMHPVLIGAGKPLFGGPAGQHNLELINSRRFGTGVIYLHYRNAAVSPKWRAA